MTGEPDGHLLLERTEELRHLDESVTALAAGEGRLGVIVGEAGIGKSSLLNAATERARKAGIRVLRARGSELERPYAHGVALSLFEPLIRSDEPDVLFAGPAATVRSLFDLTTHPTPGIAEAEAGDPFATIYGLYWLLLNATDRGPLVLAVDDVQWADDASTRFLSYLAQRVDEMPVLLIVGYRPGEPDAESAPTRVLIDSSRAVRLEPAPLSADAVGQLLEAYEPETGRAARASVWAATRGNPFFVVEVARERQRAAVVPDSVVRFVTDRIARLEPVARRLAEAVAVLGDAADLRRAARLCGLGETEAVDAARELTRVAILAPEATLEFGHPIVRDAVYSGMPGVARARAHREAALLLLAEDAAVGLVGTQLLEAERAGDPRVVDALLAAAAEALSHGEPAVSVRLLVRALDEPPTAHRRSDVVIALARAEALVASPAATERFRDALATTDDPVRRASLLLEMGRTQVSAMEWPAAAATFSEGMSALSARGAQPADSQRELRERLEAGFAAATWISMADRADAERIVAGVLSDEHPARAHRELAIWIAFQRGMGIFATAPEVSAALFKVIDAPADELILDGQSVEVASGALINTDEHAVQIDLLDRASAAAERAGAFGKVGLYAYCRSWPMYHTGRLKDAIADAQASMRIGELGWETFIPAARAVLALAQLESGDRVAAEEAATMDDARWGGRIDHAVLVPISRGRLALADGNAEGALAHFSSAAAAAAAMGVRVPGPTDAETWTAVALAQLGRLDEARAAARGALDRAKCWAARWTLGRALRAAGLVEGGPAGLELLREAVAVLEDSSARLELVRTQVDFGAALRRAGHARDARSTLTVAVDLADRLGARYLLDRALAELRAAGARPRRRSVSGREALTPSELRVAQLAAEGRTNREIAQLLFVTPKAVEFHLGNAYPKLGVSSRQQLASALADQRT